VWEEELDALNKKRNRLRVRSSKAYLRKSKLNKAAKGVA
jgi:hypothetical protein